MREKSEEEVESLLLMEKGLTEQERRRKEDKFRKVTNKLFSSSLSRFSFFRRIYRWRRKRLYREIKKLNKKTHQIDQALMGIKEDMIEALSEIANRFYLATALQERGGFQIIPSSLYYHVWELIEEIQSE